MLWSSAEKQNTQRNVCSADIDFLKLEKGVDSFDLSTSQFTLAFEAESENEGNKCMEYFPTVHIADSQYFEDLERDLNQFDAVLFEMVVTKNSCNTDTEGRRLLGKRPSSSREQRNIAKSFDLNHQIDGLNYAQANWYVADLESEAVERMHKSYYAKAESWYAYGIRSRFFSQTARRLGRNAVQEWYASGGESFALLSERELLGLGVAIAARFAASFMPCPEMLWLLMDWVSSNRGKMQGEVLMAVIRRTVMLDFAGARKLTYAQSLVSNQEQAPVGAYKVMLLARDNAAVQAAAAELQRPVTAEVQKQGNGEKSVALLYGVMHGKGIVAQAVRYDHYRVCMITVVLS
jgi:hypothetical protein